MARYWLYLRSCIRKKRNESMIKVLYFSHYLIWVFPFMEFTTDQVRFTFHANSVSFIVLTQIMNLFVSTHSGSFGSQWFSVSVIHCYDSAVALNPSKSSLTCIHISTEISKHFSSPRQISWSLRIFAQGYKTDIVIQYLDPPSQILFMLLWGAQNTTMCRESCRTKFASTILFSELRAVTY